MTDDQQPPLGVHPDPQPALVVDRDADAIHVERGVARLHVNNQTSWSNLSEELSNVDADQRIVCVVLDADPNVFDLISRCGQDDVQRLTDILTRLRQPVIVTIRGRCTADGVAVVLACSVIVASTSATIGGLNPPPVPFGSVDYARLKARLGTGKTNLLYLSGRTVRGAEAERIGLVDMVVPDDRIDRTVTELASEISERAKDACDIASTQTDVRRAPRTAGRTGQAQAPAVAAQPNQDTGATLSDPRRTVDWTTRLVEPGFTVLEHGAAVKVVFDRPEVLNAFDLDMTRAFQRIMEDLGADSTVRAVMLTGRGRAFSAGADLGDSFSAERRSGLADHLRRVTTPTILAIRQMPKPVVAAVNGPAVGVGCSFALASDIVIASESARFVLAFSKVGLSLDGGASATLVARAGFSTAMSLSLTGRPIVAQEALARGLIDEVVYADEFEAAAQDRLLALAAGPTRSYAATKRILNDSVFGTLTTLLDREAEQLAELVETADFDAAITAARSRERPRFVGFTDA